MIQELHEHSVVAVYPSHDGAEAAIESLQPLTREGMLELLSDEEVARVSSAETAYRLAEGEQYLDLDQLGRGVRSAPPEPPPMGRVLPRKSIEPQTWSRILSHLAVKSPAP
jgi:hypothetical protein